MGKKFFLMWILFLTVSATQVFAKDLQIRVGYFPNITHAQALVGMAQGEFQKQMGDVQIETKIFNAGPSVIEAMFAGQLDLAYIGPNPAINGYIKSQGEALRVVAGAASGGAALVIRDDLFLNSAQDFHGKKIASPQLGNTQDVAVRSWIKRNGLELKERGGDVQILPVANPDQLILFSKKEIDGAWTVEPWVSRLEKEGNGKIFLDERSLWPNGEYVTAHVIVSTKFLKQYPEIVKKWLVAHVDVTQWINKNPEEAKKVVNQEIFRLTGKILPADIVDQAFGRISITYDPIRASLLKSAQDAFEQGFLGEVAPDLSGIYDLTILNQILSEKGYPEIP